MITKVEHLVPGRIYQAIRKHIPSGPDEWKLFIFQYNGGTLAKGEYSTNPKVHYTISDRLSQLSLSGTLNPQYNNSFVGFNPATSQQIELYEEMWLRKTDNRLVYIGETKLVPHNYSHFNFMP
jgi:hypothetical protein